MISAHELKKLLPETAWKTLCFASPTGNFPPQTKKFLLDVYNIAEPKNDIERQRLNYVKSRLN
jgi:hypothetical protein